MQRGAPPRCEPAFRAMTLNLKLVPEMEHQDELQDLFLQGIEDREKNLVWHYRVRATHLTNAFLS